MTESVITNYEFTPLPDNPIKKEESIDEAIDDVLHYYEVKLDNKTRSNIKKMYTYNKELAGRALINYVKKGVKEFGHENHKTNMKILSDYLGKEVNLFNYKKELKNAMPYLSKKDIRKVKKDVLVRAKFAFTDENNERKSYPVEIIDTQRITSGLNKKKAENFIQRFKARKRKKSITRTPSIENDLLESIKYEIDLVKKVNEKKKELEEKVYNTRKSINDDVQERITNVIKEKKLERLTRGFFAVNEEKVLKNFKNFDEFSKSDKYNTVKNIYLMDNDKIAEQKVVGILDSVFKTNLKDFTDKTARDMKYDKQGKRIPKLDSVIDNEVSIGRFKRNQIVMPEFYSEVGALSAAGHPANHEVIMKEVMKKYYQL